MGDEVTIPSVSLHAEVMLQWAIVKTQPSSNSYSYSDFLTNFGNCRTQVCRRHRLRNIVAGVVIGSLTSATTLYRNFVSEPNQPNPTG